MATFELLKPNTDLIPVILEVPVPPLAIGSTPVKDETLLPAVAFNTPFASILKLAPTLTPPKTEADAVGKAKEDGIDGLLVKSL